MWNAGDLLFVPRLVRNLISGYFRCIYGICVFVVKPDIVSCNSNKKEEEALEMTEVIHLNEFFFHTYDSILKKLAKDKGYKEQDDELNKLEKEFPIIKLLSEGATVTDGATQQEIAAVQKYMQLKFEMQDYVEREHYFRGYRDCILFLVDCGALGTNFVMD